MTLMRLRAAPTVLIEDNENTNNIPLVLELALQEKSTLHLFCYEQPVNFWRNAFINQTNVIYHDELCTDYLEKLLSDTDKCSVIIDSINQMSINLGWNQCLNVLKKLIASSSNINKLLLILHTDCLTTASKLRINLNHIASAIITYDSSDSSTIHTLLKKSGKVVKHDEMLSFDAKTNTLKLTPIVKDKKVDNEPEKPSPGNLTTFKIEVDQTDKLEKYKLKLPYMSKINDGESKIHYEPDAVDDWDEEDPDEDLDI